MWDIIYNVIQVAPAPAIVLLAGMLWHQGSSIVTLKDKINEHVLEDARIYVQKEELDKMEERMSERFDRLENKIDAVLRK